MNDTTFNSYVIRVLTPDGKMFVNIMEDDDENVVDIKIHIGKTGSSLYAWTDALTSMVKLALDRGANIYDILQLISNITTDKLVYSSSVPIQSGPDGLVNALLVYIRQKNIENDERKPLLRRA